VWYNAFIIKTRNKKGLGMKIIHCGDIHADSKMGTHFTREEAEQRRNEIVDSFANMVSYARENEVRVIIIAGDLFDTKASQQKTIKKRIAFIMGQNPQIDFLYLRGNHDEGVDFALEQELPNLKVFSGEKWTCFSYENVDIYGREFGEKIPLSCYSELKLDSTKINIVTLHGQVADYKPKEGAPVISLPQLTNKNIDYLALGHIHDYKMEKLDGRGCWCYSGCLEGRGFDECGQKGFVLLDIGDKVQSTFLPIAKRCIHEVEVNLKGSMSYNEIMKSISNSISTIPKKDIVQVLLTGEISEDTEIERESYENALKAEFNFYYIRVKDKTENKIDYKKYENDLSLKGEFIRLVKEQTSLSEEDKSKILMLGIRALAGRLN